jgi:hypothetical protein
MRSRSAWLAASSTVLALAGCAGHARTSQQRPPRIPARVAEALAADADAVARARRCTAHKAAVRLQRDSIAAIARVPGVYQERLMSAANDIAAGLGPCGRPRVHRRGPAPRDRARTLAAWLRKNAR